MQPLISVAELADALADVVVLDVRYHGPGGPDGHEAYLQGHIPGAAFVDLDEVLADPPGAGGRHPLPSPKRFQAGMRAAGVSQDSRVVVYDGWRSIAASRVWWLLRHHGLDTVRVLDGGWKAWQAAGLPVETATAEVPVGDFVAAPGQLSTLDAEAAAELGRDGVLVDARPADRFRGENETVDAVAGHIPGACSLPALELSGPDHRMLASEELKARLGAAGLGTAAPAGAYCGSGVQAAFMTLAAAVAGISDDLPLYAGSWSEWITDPSRPVAR